MKLAKKKLPNLSWPHTSAGLCLAIKQALFDKSERLYDTAYFCGVSKLIPSFTRKNAVLSKIGEVGRGAYWWSIELPSGLTNRLDFLDWLINELEKSQENK